VRLGPLTIDRSALHSRVARRIFAIFVVCSLAPVGLFAVFAWVQVRAQLEDDALESLRSASKAAGMSILERLLIAEHGMEVLAEGFLAQEPPEDRLAVGDGRIVALERLPQERLDELSPEQHAELARGVTLLLTSPRSVGPARVRLVRRLRPADEGSPAISAELDPTFVFEPRNRGRSDRYWVVEAGGRRVFDARPDGFDTGRAHTVTASWDLFLRSRFLAPSWTVGFSRPLSAIHRPLRRFESVFPLIALAALGAAVCLSLVQIRRSLVPIEALAGAARRISDGELEARVSIQSHDEFGELGRTFNEMATQIGRQIQVLNTVNEIGARLSAERDTDALLDRILSGSIRVTRSRGGAIFLSQGGRPLSQARFRLEAGGGSSVASFGIELDPVIARDCQESRVPIFAWDEDDLGHRELAAWRTFEQQVGFSIGSRICVPMLDGQDEVVGVLLLFREGPTSDHFDKPTCELAESIASQAATAITKNRLVEDFRALFEGVVELTVRAIDEKSQYTGDHCRKVPILTEQIAEAACATRAGPLKDFDLTPEERYELHIAALLHDCGKVATPVHVMDKGTKLEAIFDRIELVEARFEIVRRDLRNAAAAAGADAELAEALRRLDDDRRFLQHCNLGVELMPEEDCERVREIARRYRYNTADGTGRALLTEEEVLNLTVRHGTLNDAERRTIEQHVVTTIDLLNELPFPRALEAVPEIAGSHHERCDGKGYPNRLRRDDITMQGRILGLADVFEALTAKDRPYKPGRTLTETLRILEAMRNDGAIDPDLYEFFVSEKVYLPYAVANLSPEQIDSAHWEDVEEFTAGAWAPPRAES